MSLPEVVPLWVVEDPEVIADPEVEDSLEVDDPVDDNLAPEVEVDLEVEEPEVENVELDVPAVAVVPEPASPAELLVATAEILRQAYWLYPIQATP